MVQFMKNYKQVKMGIMYVKSNLYILFWEKYISLQQLSMLKCFSISVIFTSNNGNKLNSDNYETPNINGKDKINKSGGDITNEK